MKNNKREYKIWQQIKSRTTKRKDKKSLCYRKNNIKMCDEWFNSFDKFYEDMGDSNGLSIDRIDTNKGYYKDNCRWATPLEQVRNRNCTIYLSYKNETKTLMEWCKQYNIPYDLAHKKYKYRGKTIDEIIEKTLPRKKFLKQLKKKVTLFTKEGNPIISFLSVRDCCDFLGYKNVCSIFNNIRKNKLIKDKYYATLI